LSIFKFYGLKKIQIYQLLLKKSIGAVTKGTIVFFIGILLIIENSKGNRKGHKRIILQNFVLAIRSR